MRRGQRQVEQVKIKLGMQMDDKMFQATLLETNVCEFSSLNSSLSHEYLLGYDDERPFEVEF